MTELTYLKAFNQGLQQMMDADGDIFVVGEDVGGKGGVFGSFAGLIDEFGERRMVDTPISEQAIVGLGIGAAVTGLRPVVDLMFMDFVMVAMDQLANQAAKLKYMFGGRARLPLTITTSAGAGLSAAAQHSQSLEAMLCHVPGLKVVMPSTPHDAKGLLVACLREDNPTIYVKHKRMFGVKGEVPAELYEVPIGVARVARPGTDVTVVAYSRMASESLVAAADLAEEGIDCEVIDLRSVQPIDIDTVVASARKTNRVVVVHEAVRFAGLGAEIAAQVQEHAFDYLDAPVARVGAPFAPVPFSPALESHYVPDAARIAAQIRETLGRGARPEPVFKDVQLSIGARPEPVSEGVQPSVGARPAPIPDTGVPVVASLAARRLADLLGVDIAAVRRTGVDPRVTRDDVALYVRQRLAGTGPAPEPAQPAPGPAQPTQPPPVPRAAGGRTRPSVAAPALAPPAQTPSAVVRMRGMRATIASRMHQSLHDMAQLTLTMDVAMDRIVADRQRRQVDGAAPSYTDYVIAAAAAALVEHPIVNSQITDEGIALLPEVNVGMAVALDKGLVVPVVRGADRLSIEEISVETARLAAAARSRSLGLPDFEGATFTVTAMGMYGVDAFTPIINPPNTAILGVGRVRRDVDWDDDDRPVPLPVLTLSLTWDHRAFDGAPAAEFTRTVLVVCSAGAANRDPAVFGEPDRFCITRRDLAYREPRGQFRMDGLPSGVAPGLVPLSKLPARPAGRPPSLYALTAQAAVAAMAALLERWDGVRPAVTHQPCIGSRWPGDARVCRRLPVEGGGSDG